MQSLNLILKLYSFFEHPVERFLSVPGDWINDVGGHICVPSKRIYLKISVLAWCTNMAAVAHENALVTIIKKKTLQVGFGKSAKQHLS